MCRGSATTHFLVHPSKEPRSLYHRNSPPLRLIPTGALDSIASSQPRMTSKTRAPGLCVRSSSARHPRL
jgi:hypothetical protein